MSLEEVTKLVKEMGYGGMEDEEDEDDDDEDDDDDEEESYGKKESKSESVENDSAVESSLVEIEIDDDLSKISESLDLSEENAEKIKLFLKLAVNSKVEEVLKKIFEDITKQN